MAILLLLVVVVVTVVVVVVVQVVGKYIQLCQCNETAGRCLHEGGLKKRPEEEIIKVHSRNL